MVIAKSTAGQVIATMSPLRGDIAQDQKRPKKQAHTKLQTRDIKRIQTDAKSALLILGVIVFPRTLTLKERLESFEDSTTDLAYYR